MNTDGIKVFHSSNYGLWPIYLSLNELPFSMRTRRENMVFAGLWFGEMKPVMGIFLPPVAQSIQALQHGFEVKPPDMEAFQCKAYLVASTCDLQAKALVMEMVAHNGYYGCPKCLKEGSHDARRHQYPNNSDGSHDPLRTHMETLAHASEAHHTGRTGRQKSTVYGIKGPSWLTIAPKFDIIRGMTIDYMHGTLLGITKALMTLWFKSDRDAPYHSSEYRAWLLYYSLPIMQFFLPTEHFENYSLLVNAIHILLGESITEEQLCAADDKLKQFVEGFQRLYGSFRVSLNIHSLIHYAQTVRELGPLWAHSCFFFEDVNGQVLRLIHGTQAVEEQVLRAVAILQKFMELGEERFKPGTASKKLYDRLSSVLPTPEERSNFQGIGGGCFAVGSLTEQTRNAHGVFSRLTKCHLDAVMATLDFPPERLMTYQRYM
ncbi:Hypp1405 [Branchiostoma lanceolatum]|nr:Hypp1405 [Branchiostoma lanceolatum]